MHLASILVFARAPVPGRCKTRLIPHLGRLGAARLHRQLTERAVATAAASGAAVELWCTPHTGHGGFHRLRRAYGLRLRRQAVGDLGAKMAGAIGQALRRGATSCVVIGTDCPNLGVGDLRQAFAALANHDAVLQPATDGGYVLIGARRLPAGALRSIRWSSGKELAQTRARLARFGLAWHELPARCDLDTPADYRQARRAGLL